MRREDWDRFGGFDPDFVMYGEEADLCHRASKEGFSPRITPEATIIHYGGASEAVRADKMVRLMKAKIELIKRQFHPSTRGLGRWLFGLWPLSRSIAFGIAGTFSGRMEWREKASIWREIWQRRAEWKDGYTP